jgi:hypothetical protein
MYMGDRFYNYVLEAAQFHFWEFINQNHAFVLDSHWPFISRLYLLLVTKGP